MTITALYAKRELALGIAKMIRMNEETHLLQIDTNVKGVARARDMDMIMDILFPDEENSSITINDVVASEENGVNGIIYTFTDEDINDISIRNSSQLTLMIKNARLEYVNA